MSEIADCFISYNHLDHKEAERLRATLEANSIKTYIFQRSLKPSKNILQSVRDSIEKCDAFIPVLSPNSLRSRWVARELGLTRSLHKKRGQEYPIVIPVYTKGAGPRRVRPCHFRTGWPLIRRLNLSSVRGLTMDSPTDPIELVVEMLSPQVKFYGEKRGDIDQVPDELWTLYERLFPKQEVRDEPSDIKEWVNTSATLGDSAKWLEILGTQEVLGRVIGFIYVSGHPETGYLFGNYFAMDLWWREYGRAEALLDAFELHVQNKMPHAKGLLYEVETYDKSIVTSLLARLRTRSGVRPKTIELTDRETETVRAIRRLNLYAAYPKKKSLCLLNEDGSPFNYRQPAMSHPLDQTNEAPFLIMVRRLGKFTETTLEAREVTSFIYDHLYSDAYEKDSATAIPGYEVYLKDLKDRVLAGSSKYLKLGEPIGRDEKHLIHQLNRAGVQTQL
jgi:TIR domain